MLLRLAGFLFKLEANIPYTVTPACHVRCHVRLSHTPVTYACRVCLSHTPVTYACHVCVSRMHITYACHIRLSRTPVTYACWVCLSGTPVAYACHVRMSRTHVTYACHVRMSRTLPIECQCSMNQYLLKRVCPCVLRVFSENIYSASYNLTSLQLQFRLTAIYKTRAISVYISFLSFRPIGLYVLCNMLSLVRVAHIHGISASYKRSATTQVS